MYSLTIHFGPNAICWAFLFKDKDKAFAAYELAAEIPHAMDALRADNKFFTEDDFGQTVSIPFADIHGVMLEDLDLVEAARIQRSLAEERCKVKLMAAAKADPVIRQAMQGGPQVLQPRFNG